MPIIDVTPENLKDEHICCAISEKKGENGISSKKSWMNEAFKDGLVFKKLDERGKVFIQYMPAEKAWAPVDADGYMWIDCFWVSGKFKGQGIGTELINECIQDSKAKGKKGVVTFAGSKKMGFLNDGKYLKSKGFEVCDSAEPYYELLYLPFEEGAKKPVFRESVHKESLKNEGFVIYYSDKCPFNDKYTKILKKTADENNQKLELIKINSLNKAKNAVNPSTIFAIYKDGKFIGNEILSVKKFLTLI